MQDDKDDLTAR